MSKVFELWEPMPVEPPRYNSVAPWNGRPVYDQLNSISSAPVPGYEASVYKVCVFQRKMEWTSPYEMAQQRHWKSCIVELNNTQLNVYDCPINLDDPSLQKVRVQSSYSSQNSHSLLHPYHYRHLMLKTGGKCKFSAFKPSESRPYNEEQYNSTFTTKNDLLALRTFKSLRLIDSRNIIRSYSLQYGKLGLAIDYKKKHFVLRLRLESEQFLLEFPCAEAIIEWYNAITLGIDTSLDLNRREIPKYRSVPRRRRRRKQQKQRRFSGNMKLKPANTAKDIKITRNNSFDTLFKRSNGNLVDGRSDPGGGNAKLIDNGGNFVSKFFSGIKSKKSNRNDRKPSMNRSGSQISADDIRKALKTLSLDEEERTTVNEAEDEEDEEEEEGVGEGEGEGEGDFFDEDDEEDYELDQILGDEPVPPELPTVEVEAGEFNHEKGNATQIQRNSISSRSTMTTSMKSGLNNKQVITPNTSCECVHKFPFEVEEPLKTTEYYIAKVNDEELSIYSFRSQRKILRDSIRCIPPMTENERWNGKFIVLDTIEDKYFPRDYEIIHQNLYRNEEHLIHITGVGPQYVHKFQRKLQEWLVTPTGIVPCVNTTN